jgi:hypothetical protein
MNSGPNLENEAMLRRLWPSERYAAPGAAARENECLAAGAAALASGRNGRAREEEAAARCTARRCARKTVRFHLASTGPIGPQGRISRFSHQATPSAVLLRPSRLGAGNCESAAVWPSSGETKEWHAF